VHGANEAEQGLQAWDMGQPLLTSQLQQHQ
jgi:hypothetical protein